MGVGTSRAIFVPTPDLDIGNLRMGLAVQRSEVGSWGQYPGNSGLAGVVPSALPGQVASVPCPVPDLQRWRPTDDPPNMRPHETPFGPLLLPPRTACSTACPTCVMDRLGDVERAARD